jgi:hypothetical protein
MLNFTLSQLTSNAAEMDESEKGGQKEIFFLSSLIGLTTEILSISDSTWPFEADSITLKTERKSKRREDGEERRLVRNTEF